MPVRATGTPNDPARSTAAASAKFTPAPTNRPTDVVNAKAVARTRVSYCSGSQRLNDTRVRATAFAFTTSVGRFVGAGVNFALAAAVLRAGSLGVPVALTGIAFGLGLLVIPFALETRGQRLPE